MITQKITIAEDMKFLFDALLMVTLYVASVVVLNTDITQVLTIVGASVSGAIVLAYFRRDRDRKEIFFKSSCAAISGLVSGAVLCKYYEIGSTEYALAVYFFTSLLSLFFIKGLLSVTEQNATGFVMTVIQRILNTQSSNYKLTPDVTTIETDVIIKPLPEEGKVKDSEKE